ncbi:hypothetical protein [Falsiroseomonas tokyonensis]|uniref:Uncharacterized protein n=1 Tax=Falsiroseomonas tokyonensis TaxID=430521 RepID=A0ABV7C456_9PROT|nr:hypothetical protein [Falsiroseomonas tokyonensis]MBU8541419.1 hypothetical protein [Falsiroseomonas tokyonensis]
MRSADIVLVAKANAAPEADVWRVMAAARQLDPVAALLRTASRVTLPDAEAVARPAGARLICIMAATR